MVSNKLDLELGADAQRIIADARGFDDPAPEDHERVKARWLASVAAAAGVSSLSDTAGAATSGVSWGLKGASLALAIAAGVSGVYFMSSSSGSEPELVRAPGGATLAAPAAAHGAEPSAALSVRADEERQAEQPAAEQPEPSDPEVVAPETKQPVAALTRLPLPEVAREPARRAVSARPRLTAFEPSPARARLREVASAPEAVPTATSGQLSEEISLLSRVRAGLREGGAGRALDLLGEYRTRFERPILGMEAAALRVDALCQTGQREAARSAAGAFLNSWPASPLEQRVSSACSPL